jgi:hypothetical protein
LARWSKHLTNHDQESEGVPAEPGRKRPGRSWTERFSGQIRYRRFSDLDAGGRPSIFFKFELAPGQSDLPQGVYDILHELKHLQPRTGRDSKPQPTNLEFSRTKKHGRVWRMPDNPQGRTAADIIDAKLADLAAKLEAEPDRGR